MPRREKSVPTTLSPSCAATPARSYEAVIQFALYIGYVVIMAYNVNLNKCTRSCLRLE